MLLAGAPITLARASEQARAAEIAADAFFQHPACLDVKLSPDGRHVALIARGSAGRYSLSVVDLATKTRRQLAAYEANDVGHIEWTNSNRLFYVVAKRTYNSSVLTSFSFARLYGINVDGSEHKELLGKLIGPGRALSFTARVAPANLRELRNSPYVHLIITNKRKRQLVRVHSGTDEWEEIVTPTGTVAWWLDHTGTIRLVETHQADQVALHYLDPASRAWTVVHQRHVLDGEHDAITPLGFAPDGTLLVVSNGGRDTTAVTIFDLANKRLAVKPVLAIAGFDFDGRMVADDTRLLGFTFRAEEKLTHWLDERMRAVQAEVDQRLAGTANLVIPALRPGARHVLVQAQSEAQPLTYFAYDCEIKKLTRLGVELPDIDAALMGPRQFVRYRTRDGMSIPATLTLPAGAAEGKPAKPYPMVVLLAATPFNRFSGMEWLSHVSYLASRGYAVLCPAWRGAQGLGRRHAQAGWRQWGAAMLDDVIDATQWAVGAGYADAAHMAVLGVEYGGHAALMAMARHPTLFRCAALLSPVIDETRMVSTEWISESMSDAMLERAAVRKLGDAKVDAQRLSSNAILQQTNRLTQPLLIGYGGLEPHFRHGFTLRDALKAHNLQVEWVLYENDWAELCDPVNLADYWSRVERFLGKHLALRQG